MNNEYKFINYYKKENTSFINDVIVLVYYENALHYNQLNYNIDKKK